MKLIFIIATSLLVYLYWTELIKPWWVFKKKPEQSLKAFSEHLDFLNKNVTEINPSFGIRSSIGLAAAQNLLPTDAFKEATDYLHKNLDVLKTQMGMEDTLYGTLTVSIAKPVLLCGKANNLKIYHPDNSVEIYSNRWKRYQTPHASVYSYATATKSAIIENID